jgi:HD domain
MATRRADPIPTRIAGILVPQDDVSVAAWQQAQRALPGYLLSHSVRSYCWGVTIGIRERWPIDSQVLWAASLFHDEGLTRIRANDDCFELAGARQARRWLERAGMSSLAAERVERAIALHMQPAVTLQDGIESVLLDRATGLDVRGVGYQSVADVRSAVVRRYPRGDFDRRFLAAIRREVAVREGCQSTRLLEQIGIAEPKATSPWTVR